MTTGTLQLSPADERELAHFEARVNTAVRATTYANLPGLATDEQMKEAGYATRQSRKGEESRNDGLEPRLRALMTDTVFWACAAELPDNDITSPRTSKGRPPGFPSWLCMYVMSAAGIGNLASIRAAVTYLVDPPTWARFVADINPYVPKGWTTLTESKRPKQHHMDYFIERWKAKPRITESGEIVDHRWKGVRRKFIRRFEQLSTHRAQEMGYLTPALTFNWNKPNRANLVRMDGTVFTFKVPQEKADRHELRQYKDKTTGKMSAGHKTMIASVASGEWNDRIVLSVTALGSHRYADGSEESPHAPHVIDAIQNDSRGGVHILAFDSAVRGRGVTALQRAGVVVVNYPHAHQNPGIRNGSKKKRLGTMRVEKSLLLTNHRHSDTNGDPCTHPVYAVGGHLMVAREDKDGKLGTTVITPKKYERRVTAGGTVREYLIIDSKCADPEHSTEIRVPLFHGKTGTRRTPNYGESVRVFAPGTPQFRHLYGARNDTETINATIKRCIKEALLSPGGQLLRILGVAIAENAYAYALWQKRRGMPNAIDGNLKPPP